MYRFSGHHNILAMIVMTEAILVTYTRESEAHANVDVQVQEQGDESECKYTPNVELLC